MKELTYQIIVAVALGVFIVIIGMNKGLFESEATSNTSPPPSQSAPQLDDDLLEGYEGRDLKWALDKLKLVAIIQNGNSHALKMNRPDKVILINKDWTIPAIPDHLTLDDEQLEFLESQLE